MRRAVAALLLQSCASGGDRVSISVDGQIRGEEVRLRSGFFVQDDRYTPPGQVEVWLVGADRGGAGGCNGPGVDQWCETSAYVYDTLADDKKDGKAAWAEYFPEDFWIVNILIRAQPEQDLSNQTIDGVGFDQVVWNLEAPVMAASFTHHMGGERYGTGSATFLSDGGHVRITEHQPGRKIGGVLVTDALGFDAYGYGDHGVKQGKLEIEFTGVERCRPMEGI